MNYLLLFFLVLPALSGAQPTVSGLGDYIIGLTTPDSLNQIDFNEEDQSYVKGTLTLPCTHIRTFTSAAAVVAGVAVTNLVFVFYDGRLFKISCDYSDPLKEAFVLQYGPGALKPTRHFQFCT